MLGRVAGETPPEVSAARSPSRAALLVLAAALGAVCGPTGSTKAQPSPSRFVIPTELANGRVEISIAPSYRLGTTAVIQVAVTASRGAITGPLTSRVLASGIPERGRVGEALVRTLAAPSLRVRAGERQTFSLSWDGRDEHGVLVPADAYSLVLEFGVEDGGTTRTATAGTTLEMREP